MFSLGEMLVMAVVALLVIKPQDWPRIFKRVYPYVSRLQDIWSHYTTPSHLTHRKEKTIGGDDGLSS